MRFLPALFLFFSIASYAQNDSLFEFSRLEKFCMEPNRFIQLSADTIGAAGDVHAGVLTAYDLNSGQKERSVCFIAGGFNSIIFSQTNTQIDIRDLRSFTAALKKMSIAAASERRDEWKRYQYTASNMTVLALENRHNNTGRWDVVLYKRYRNSNAAVPGSALFIREKKLDELLELLLQYSDYLGSDLYK